MNHLPDSAEHPNPEPSFWRRPADQADEAVELVLQQVETLGESWQP